MDKDDAFYDECLKKFTDITNKSTQFLQASEALTQKTKQNLKEIYDFTKATQRRKKSSALSKLIVDNFDLEQIWQQLELQNNELVADGLVDISKFVTAKNTLFFKSLESAVEDEKEPSDNDMDEEESMSVEDHKDEEDWSNETTDGEEQNDLDEVPSQQELQDFFNQKEMERFLEAEEKKMQQTDIKTHSESESEAESDIDLFGSEDESDNDKTAKYKDFFASNDVRKDEPQREEEEEMSDDDEEQPSGFEQRQERLKRRIEEIEEDAIQDKPWQLKGEITADKRPKNSMLEEIVDFDLTTRPAPVMTEQTSMQLEDIIRQRIKDKVFDSVVRKAKPVETPLEYKKKLVLDQEKSKESLAQIYEKEFLAQQAALDPHNDDSDKPEPQLHQEIESMMRSLFAKLDSLSNFHFTPKPAMPELKIVSNLPAISMEEVAPVASSDAALLAPEEIKAKGRGDLLGSNERTSTDKKRQRRKKKLKQKVHKKRIEVLEQKPVKGGKLMDKLSKGKNVTKMSETSPGIKTSKAFFTQLEQAKTQTYQKTKDSKKKANTGSAKKFKL